MTTSRFVYASHLPVSGLTIPATAEKDSKDIEIILNPGKEVEIPSGFVASPNIQSLIEDGYLIPVKEEEEKQQEAEKPPITTASRAKNTTPEDK